MMEGCATQKFLQNHPKAEETACPICFMPYAFHAKSLRKKSGARLRRSKYPASLLQMENHSKAETMDPIYFMP